MICRPEAAPRTHAITAYDFEWRKSELEPSARGHRARLSITWAGAYDERGYVGFRTLEGFLNWALTTENCGRRFYAHFGGASDMVFLIRLIAKRKSLQIRAIFSSSSAIVVSVEDRHSRRWTFIDSFWTMRVPLRTIGQWLSDEKLEFDHTREHTEAELRTYNEQDCKVLYKALCYFQDVINDFGGELRVTGASTALDLFLRRYLLRPIRNSPLIDDYVRPAYQSSRVEPLRLNCAESRIYDINSSFPYSMTFELPGDCIGAYTREGRPSLPDGGLWVADCDVRVPEQWLPPLPFRQEERGRVFFPTGRFRARITSEDFLCGDFDVEKVYSCWTFEPRLDLAAYASDLFDLRARSSGFDSQVWKIVNNSTYGKFAEGAEKEVLLVNPVGVTPALEPLAPGIFMGAETIDVPHSHVPFSAFITARSRRILRQYALEAYRLSGEVSYLDTDSVFTPAELPTGKRLGELKLEAEIKRGVFHAAKMYAYEKLDGRELVKAKGFSRVVSDPKSGASADTSRLTYDDFLSLREAGSVAIERMRRIKELVREAKGFDFEPDVIISDKMLRAPRPKRKSHGSVETVPWDVAELLEAS